MEGGGGNNLTMSDGNLDKINAVSLAIIKFKSLFFNAINSSTKSNPFILGMGSGTTASLFFNTLFGEIESLSGKDIFIMAIFTSYQSITFVPKNSSKIFVTCVSSVDHVDCLVDGADKIFLFPSIDNVNGDKSQIIIKGGGGAHTLEKLVQKLAKHTMYIVEEKKISSSLVDCHIPLEILPFSINYVVKAINEHLKLKNFIIREAKQGKIGPIVTENGNLILDLAIKESSNVNMEELATFLDSITGIVEHGIFVNVANIIIIGNGNGSYSLP